MEGSIKELSAYRYTKAMEDITASGLMQLRLKIIFISGGRYETSRYKSTRNREIGASSI